MSNAPPAYFNDEGVAIIRASSLGRCEAALVHSLLGQTPQPPPPDMLRRFEDGHLHEPAIIEELRKRGYEIAQGSQQREVQVHVAGGIVVNGHIDGIASLDGPPGPVVFDAKALADSGAKKWAAAKVTPEWLLDNNPGYAWQISVYMHALKLPGMFAVKNKNSGEVKTYLIPKAPLPLHKIKARASRVVRLAQEHQVPECGADRDDYMCPFRSLHETTRNTLEKIGGPSDVSALDDLASSYQAAKALAADWDGRAKELRDQLLSFMDDEDMLEGETEHWVLEQKSITSKRLNQTKLKAAVDLTPYYEESTSVRLEVKPK